MEPNSLHQQLPFQAVATTTTSALMEILSRYEALESIPVHIPNQLEVGVVRNEPIAHSIEIETTPIHIANTLTPVTTVVTATAIPSVNPIGQNESDSSKPRVGRPRTKPPKEKRDWHFHLGGVRHCRVPLTAEQKEVLEVAYVSRIMSKNFRKEGQPEKERIARISGISLDKVQEWFKNRRKKDKLIRERTKCDDTRGKKEQISLVCTSASESPTVGQEVSVAMEINSDSIDLSVTPTTLHIVQSEAPFTVQLNNVT